MIKRGLLGLICLLLVACATKSVSPSSAPEAVIAPVVTPDELVASFNSTPYLNQSISVEISQGTVNFNDINGEAAYAPLTVILKPEGEASVHLIKAGDNFFNSNASLSLSYKAGVLVVDGGSNSPGYPITMTELWLKGAVYDNINTKGAADLEGATVRVKLIPA